MQETKAYTLNFDYYLLGFYDYIVNFIFYNEIHIFILSMLKKHLGE